MHYLKNILFENNFNIINCKSIKQMKRICFFLIYTAIRNHFDTYLQTGTFLIGIMNDKLFL